MICKCAGGKHGLDPSFTVLFCRHFLELKVDRKCAVEKTLSGAVRWVLSIVFVVRLSSLRDLFPPLYIFFYASILLPFVQLGGYRFWILLLCLKISCHSIARCSNCESIFYHSRALLYLSHLIIFMTPVLIQYVTGLSKHVPI